jgi:hypothetical protein
MPKGEYKRTVQNTKNLGRKKLPEEFRRIAINFTMTKDVYEEFRKLCDDKAINGSKLVENYIIKFVQENK